MYPWSELFLNSFVSGINNAFWFEERLSMLCNYKKDVTISTADPLGLFFFDLDFFAWHISSERLNDTPLSNQIVYLKHNLYYCNILDLYYCTDYSNSLLNKYLKETRWEFQVRLFTTYCIEIIYCIDVSFNLSENLKIYTVIIKRHL
jgi:hypothetical protein